MYKFNNVKYLFIVVVLSSALTMFAQEQIDIQYSYADSLFEKQQLFDAITEFKRLLFFDKEGKYLFDANLKIGLSYKGGAKYDNAIFYFKKAEKYSHSEKQKYQTAVQIIRVNILRGTTERALQLLNRLERAYKSPNEIKEINYWRGWAYMFADNWEKADSSFTRINPNHPLKKICEEVIDNKYSVTFAKLISYILPGVGQFYTGHFVSGLMSLSWNILWGYLTVNAFMNDRVFDGMAIGNLLWFRFYRGNYQNAEKFAVQKNISIANKALRKVQLEYKGVKP